MIHAERGCLVLAWLCACIVPDRDIQIDPGIANEGAVRIVERAPQLDEMIELCNVEDIEDADLRYCPEVRTSLSSGIVSAPAGKFCVCPEGSRDNHALFRFGIYAEDSDLDDIYGVALLDPDTRDNPREAVAYDNYWSPGRAGLLEQIGLEAERRVAPPVGRRIVELTLFPFVDQERGDVDLCNDNNGDKLSVGLHDLRFMVTDRPFFRPIADEATGELGNPQPGVPDLAAGASYATIDYVFECVDPNDPEIKAHDDAVRMQMMLDDDVPQRDPGDEEVLYCDCTEVDDG